tara:strand:+ start:244 stop:639 length:396 start_codon:yes stop_codon:yes gene_type:complete
MNYKLEEIAEHFATRLSEYDRDYLFENWDDLHHEIFNTDYYIIGRYQATKWLGEEVFNVIQHIKEYEQDNFGEVTTDLSEPEQVVNMYVYIIGVRVVYAYQDKVTKENYDPTDKIDVKELANEAREEMEFC